MDILRDLRFWRLALAIWVVLSFFFLILRKFRR